MTRALREVTSVSHLSLYRKWRPQTFEDVLGQSRVTQTLQNAITANRFVHAYLFSGHRGTGKTTTARILAKALNCERGPTPVPCNVCAICRAISNGVSLDVMEIDAASNRGIDEIRDLREKVKLVPVEGRYKIYIIDEAHMLTTEAANALLKTLEEPPPHAIFVLVTTEPHRLPTTITSRTQRFDFKRIPLSVIVDRLRAIAGSEGVDVEEGALHVIARAADGALRDAESMLDQLSAFCQSRINKADVLAVLGLIEEEVAQQVADAAIAQDAAACLELANRVIAEGRDVRQILRSLIDHFRDLLVVAVVRDPSEIVETSDDRLEVLRAQSARFSPAALLQKIRILAAAEAEARFATQPRVVLEMAILKVCRPELDPSIEGLAARIEALERQAGRDRPPAPGVGSKTLSPPPAELAAQPARTSPKRMPRDRGSQSAEPVAGVPAARSGAPHGAMPRHDGAGAGEDTEGRSAQDPEEAGVTIEAVRIRWPQLMEEVKGRSRPAYAFLLEASPQSVDGARLVLAVRHKFHLENLQEPKHRQIVEEILEAVMGIRLRLGLVLDAFDTPPASAVSLERPDPKGADTLVEEAVRRFGNPVREIRHPE
jgi:DNA polymerase III subunit gamma/tau